MTNPFETEDTSPEATAAEVEATEDLDLDVEALDEVDETDEVEETDAKAEKPAKAPKAKEKKEPARPPVPEGYITPVAFAKVLTQKLNERGFENGKGLVSEENPITSQMVYSYIKNSAGGKNPLTTHSVGGRDNLLVEEEALQWWLDKIDRVATRKENAAAKAAKKAENAAKKGDAEEAETVGAVEEAE